MSQALGTMLDVFGDISRLPAKLPVAASPVTPPPATPPAAVVKTIPNAEIQIDGNQIVMNPAVAMQVYMQLQHYLTENGALA